MDNEMTIENMEAVMEAWQKEAEEREKIEEEYKIKFIQEQGIAKWITRRHILRKETKYLAMFIIQKLIVENKESITTQDAVDAIIFVSINTATKYFKQMEEYGFLTSRKFGRKIKYFLTENENSKKEIYKLLEIIREHEIKDDRIWRESWAGKWVREEEKKNREDRAEHDRKQKELYEEYARQKETNQKRGEP